MEESPRAPLGATARGRAAAVHVDSVTLALVLAPLLSARVMVSCPSITTASRDTGNPFYFLERQLLTALGGIEGAVFVFCFRMDRWQRLSHVLLAAALV